MQHCLFCFVNNKWHNSTFKVSFQERKIIFFLPYFASITNFDVIQSFFYLFIHAWSYFKALDMSLYPVNLPSLICSLQSLQVLLLWSGMAFIQHSLIYLIGEWIYLNFMYKFSWKWGVLTIICSLWSYGMQLLVVLFYMMHFIHSKVWDSCAEPKQSIFT